MNIKHIIQTVCFETKTGDEALAQEFTAMVKKMDVETLLGKLFRKYEHHQNTLRIERLEIDAGWLLPGEENLLAGRITEQLEAAVDEYYSQPVPARGIMSGNGHTVWEDESSLLANRQEARTETEQIQLLLHYLQTGQLPWHTATQRPDMKSVLAKLLAQQPEPLMMQLKPLLTQQPVLKRLLLLLSVSDYEILLRQLLPAAAYELYSRLYTAVQSIPAQAMMLPGENRWRRHFLHGAAKANQNETAFAAFLLQWFSAAIVQQPPAVLRQTMIVLKQALKETVTGQTVFFADLIKMINKKSPGVAVKKRKNSIAAKDTAVSDPKENEAIPGRQKRKEQVNETGPAVKKNNPVSSKKENLFFDEPDDVMPLNDDMENENEDAGNSFITNAGLVLLNASLLKQYFERLGWVADKQIVNEVCLDKILRWLHFLVWGEEPVYEYDLQLGKVLAGLSPSAIAENPQPLTADEKAAGIELLETVIHHWEALKGTSVDALRQTFLQRSGRLTEDESGWQLHVESKGVDILIDRLPWTFSIIKFPWMTKPLFTEWLTKI
jgi:hypothetical protein